MAQPDDDEEEEKVVRKGEDAKTHKELDKLGGDVGGEKEVDTGKAQNALTRLETAEALEKARKLERERELAKVKIEKKDVDLIVAGTFLASIYTLFASFHVVLCTEMEIDETKAERILRENNGDPILALRALINS